MKPSSLSKLIALFVILLISYHTPSFSQDAEKLYQKGLVKEEGEGSLQEAIDIYNQVVENTSADRSLRAKALLHIGICYEKLGQENAKRIYRKLITDFADQEAIVAIGREKLSSLEAGEKVPESDELIIRQVWSPAEDVYKVSPDGRYITYIDWVAIELAVKDLKTGEAWNITDKGTWKPPMQYPDMSVWAPDSKHIAYFWFNGDTTELHIINADGSEDRIICNGLGNNTPWPVDWSSDGKYILAFNNSGKETSPMDIVDQVVLVTVADGSIRVLDSHKGIQSGCCGSFSPGNQYITYAHQQESGSENNDIFLLELNGTRKGRIVTDPANDINPLWTPDGSGIIFISDRLGTKDIWSIQLNNGVPAGEAEIVKTNLGERTYLMGVTNDESVYYSNLSAREDVFITKLDFMSGEILSEPQKISSTSVERNNKPVWSPDGRYIAYCEWTGRQNNSLGYQYGFVIYDSETGNSHDLVTDLYGSGGNYWLQPQWSPDGKSLLIHGRTGKDKLQGFFLVDINTGERTSVFVKDLEPLLANTQIGIFPKYLNNGQEIIYLSNDRKTFIRRNIATKKEQKIYTDEDEILHYTLSPDGSQIAFGYFFNNRNAVYIIPTAGGEKRRLVGYEEKVTPYVISFTPDNKYVLYEYGAYSEKESHEIMRVPVTGGDPERVLALEDLFPQGEVRNIEIHPDGQQVVLDIILGQGMEVWKVENLFKK